MIVEKSCGAVVFTRKHGQIKYLIERYEKQYYGFPKGHLSSNSSEKDCVITEIKKETGLDIVLIDGFVTHDSYPLVYKGLPNVTKTIVYFWLNSKIKSRKLLIRKYQKYT